MYLVILGREPKISLAELEAVFGATNVKPVAGNIALVVTKKFDLNRLGGTIKAGRVLDGSPVEMLLAMPEGKITLGYSDYSEQATKNSSWHEALKLKNLLKRRGKSVRLVPNVDAALSSATSHHNQLGEKVRHIEIIRYGKYVAESIGTQNITAYAKRDQARPARDAFVGMLPPKLAQILVNMAVGATEGGRLLDPFCGTGTVLQEAMLMGYEGYGTDLSEKMVKYTTKNLDWLATRYDGLPKYELAEGDATKTKWKGKIDFVASETYLGQPFSAPPSDIKLKEVQYTTKAITLSFLKNLTPQIEKGTQLALAIPAWKRPDNSFSHLKIIDEIEKLGYNVHSFKHATTSDLLYYRENQVVARQIIVLRKS
ncbi:MAG: TRM11 family SAM-dependent methyltransferase [Candidatus Saccharimonadales bacterium]